MATEDNVICRTQALRPTTDLQRAFSIEEFCRRFGIGRTKVYEELGLGRLRARKVGRRTIITEDDAEDWLRRLPLMKWTDGHGEVVIMSAASIASDLGGRKPGSGWTARCPAHDDHMPSLSITDADDGKALARCHAGCESLRFHVVLNIHRAASGWRWWRR